MIITLYSNCKLNDKYYECFSSKTTLDTYLATLNKLQIYSGDDIYYTNDGTIAIDNSTLTGFTANLYNYMVFNDNGRKRYCFIESIQLINTTAVITYKEDIWSNYAISSGTITFNIKSSFLNQTSSLSTSSDISAVDLTKIPKQLPVNYEGYNNPSFYYANNENAEEEMYILITASLYKTYSQGTTNIRYINNYLISYKEKQQSESVLPLDTSEHFTWKIENENLNVLNDIITLSGSQSVTNRMLNDPNWNYDIISIKLIPKSIGDSMFTSVLSSDDLHDDGLFKDFEVNTGRYDWDSNNTSNQYFPMEIYFNNLSIQSIVKYRQNGELRYQFNGFEANDIIDYSGTMRGSADSHIIGFGNYSRFIPYTWNGLDATYQIRLHLNVNDCVLTLEYDNQIIDITSDFEYTIPISTQSADITQQQATARNIATITGAISIFGDTINAGSKIGSMIASNGSPMNRLQEGFGSINAVGGLISKGIQLDSINAHNYVTNKAICREEISVTNCIIGGFREVIITANNDKYVNQIVNRYGYLYNLLISDINTVLNDNSYTRFEYANVYGDFTQSIGKIIEGILTNGVYITTS